MGLMHASLRNCTQLSISLFPPPSPNPIQLEMATSPSLRTDGRKPDELHRADQAAQTQVLPNTHDRQPCPWKRKVPTESKNNTQRESSTWSDIIPGFSQQRFTQVITHFPFLSTKFTPIPIIIMIKCRPWNLKALGCLARPWGKRSPLMRPCHHTVSASTGVQGAQLVCSALPGLQSV